MTKSKERAALRLPNKEGGRMWAVTIDGETVPVYHSGRLGAAGARIKRLLAGA